MIKYSKTRERFVHGETIVSVKYQRKCRKRDACNPLSSCLPPQQSVVGQFNDRTNDCPPLVRVHDPFSFVPATIPANHAVRRSDSVWRMRGKFFFFLFFSFSLFLAQCPVSSPPIRSPLIREFFANHNFTILNNHDFLVKFPRFEVFKTELSCDSVSDNHYNFFSPTIQINLCQDFQLISSSLKNGTTRQTRFQNNHPLRD